MRFNLIHRVRKEFTKISTIKNRCLEEDVICGPKSDWSIFGERFLPNSGATHFLAAAVKIQVRFILVS